MNARTIIVAASNQHPHRGTCKDVRMTRSHACHHPLRTLLRTWVCTDGDQPIEWSPLQCLFEQRNILLPCDHRIGHNGIHEPHSICRRGTGKNRRAEPIERILEIECAAVRSIPDEQHRTRTVHAAGTKHICRCLHLPCHIPLRIAVHLPACLGGIPQHTHAHKPR